MEDQKEELFLTLILKESQLKVKRRQLICKSQYFATLLSTSYIDYCQQEHNINYDISISTLQNYISWIHDEYSVGDTDPLDKPSLDKFVNDNSPERLLKLLYLSVLFLTDKLTQDIIYIIESIWLIPKYSIDIWLIAMDLGITILKDLSFAACLEYFSELPLDKLKDLDKHNLEKLIKNRNLQDKWFFKDIIKTEKPVLSSIVIYDPESCKNELSLYCWNNNKFFEHSRFRYPKEIVENQQVLVGMQFTGRGYNLYMCGGEYRIGSGKFNKKIWRYSLISKKWFVETNMLTARRHMVAVFIENKLYLVGGVGTWRMKQSSVHIYDIRTKTWTTGASLPCKLQFTDPPTYGVTNWALIITELGLLYVYLVETNTWLCISRELSLDTPRMKVQVIMYNDEMCYIDVNETNDAKEPYEIFLTCAAIDNKKCVESTCVKKDLEVYYNSLPRPNAHRMKWPSYNLIISTVKLNDNKWAYVIQNDISKFYPLSNISFEFHLHSIPILKSIKFNSLFPSNTPREKQFFYIMDPAVLQAASKT